MQTPTEIEASPVRKEDVLEDQRLLGRAEFNERLDAEIEALRKVLRNIKSKGRLLLGMNRAPFGHFVGIMWAIN